MCGVCEKHTKEVPPSTALSISNFRIHLQTIFIQNHNHFSIPGTILRTNSPISGKVVCNSQFTADEDVVKVDSTRHGPELQTNACYSEETIERMLVLEISWIWDPVRLPYSLNTKHNSALENSMNTTVH